jgi:hypothetical protein
MKKITLMALASLGLLDLSAQSVYTSTGNGNWSSSFNLSGSGNPPRKYVIRIQDTITVNTTTTHAIDTVDVYGQMIFQNARKLDITSSGIIMLQSGATIIDGNGGSKFDFATGTDIVGPFTVTGTAYAQSNTGGSFILGALPLTWLDLNLTGAGRNISIDWTTSEEHNTRDFEVQTSNDGRNWIALHSLPAAGNSSTPSAYSYIHREAGTGGHFYRIRQNDQNGSYSFSEVRHILLAEPVTLVCSPNPVQDFLSIEPSRDETLENISVFDLNGSLLPVAYAFTGSYRVDMRGLDAGMYVVQILLSDGTSRVIKVIRS